MSRSLLLAILLCIPAVATAQWLPHVAVTVGIAADCGTTMHALRDPLAVEVNPLLGSRPSPARVVGTCVATAGLAWWGMNQVPREWRGPLAMVFLMGEVLIVAHNLRVIG